MTTFIFMDCFFDPKIFGYAEAPALVRLGSTVLGPHAMANPLAGLLGITALVWENYDGDSPGRSQPG